MNIDTNGLITPDLIRLDTNAGNTPHNIHRHIVTLLHHAGRTSNPDALLKDVEARHTQSSTGFKGGIAIPHCRSEHVNAPTLVFLRLANPVDFAGPDGPADLIFFIAMPHGADAEHLTIMSHLARGLVKKDFRAALRGTDNADDAINIIDTTLTNAIRKNSGDQQITSSRESITIVAVTACPTGIAHTYMAADALAHAAGKRKNVDLVIETQGASGKTPLPEAALNRARAAIIASDIEIHQPSRFDTIPTLSMSVRRALEHPDDVIAEAIDMARTTRQPQSEKPRDTTPADTTLVTQSATAVNKFGAHALRRIKQAMLTGTSYMVPFVAASGLLIALSFLLAGTQVPDFAQQVVADYSLWNLPHATDGNIYTFGDNPGIDINRAGLWVYLGAAMSLIGSFGMQAIVPILSAYIAYGLSHKPGIAPGFIGGAISWSMGAGFIGGIVTGILAGLITSGLAKLSVPKAITSLMPMVVIPLLGTMIVGLSMYLVLGKPLSWAMTTMHDWLSGLSHSSALLIGLVVGLMMASDLGGPINKAAYIFATAGLTSGTEGAQAIMAAVMAAGMVPPLAVALATAIAPHNFTASERDNGKAGWLLGASFISEGAIPIAAADPLRVIPAIAIGSGITGALSMGLGATTLAPHGGVFVLFAITSPITWIFSIVCGTIVGGITVVSLKKFWPQRV